MRIFILLNEGGWLEETGLAVKGNPVIPLLIPIHVRLSPLFKKKDLEQAKRRVSPAAGLWQILVQQMWGCLVVSFNSRSSKIQVSDTKLGICSCSQKWCFAPRAPSSNSQFLLDKFQSWNFVSTVTCLHFAHNIYITLLNKWKKCILFLIWESYYNC